VNWEKRGGGRGDVLWKIKDHKDKEKGKKGRGGGRKWLLRGGGERSNE